MFRKWIACALTVVMLFAAVGVAEAEGDDVYQIEPLLLTLLDQTATEWYESEASRAVFATAVWLDIVLSENEALSEAATNAVENDRVYVAKDGLALYAYFWADEGCVLATYKPLTEELYAGISIEADVTDAMATYVMKELEKSDSFSSYYQIDKDVMYTTLELILDALED